MDILQDRFAQVLRLVYPDPAKADKGELRKTTIALIGLHNSTHDALHMYMDAEVRGDAHHMRVVTAYLAVFHPSFLATNKTTDSLAWNQVIVEYQQLISGFNPFSEDSNLKAARFQHKVRDLIGNSGGKTRALRELKQVSEFARLSPEKQADLLEFLFDY